MSTPYKTLAPGFQHKFLTVLGRAEPARNKHGQALYLVKCVCGKIKPMRSDHIKRLASCGCMRNQLFAQARQTHGHAVGRKVTPEYRAWQEMRSRCYKLDNKRYSRYGGRGIQVCDEWRNDFIAFFDYIGPRPPQPPGQRLWSLDRIDNNGDYEPGNVRWATAKQQARNRG